MDHTVQIGDLKCMIIVGFRLSAWRQREDRRLSYADVELVGLWPVRTSTGEIVDEQMESAFCNPPQQRGKARYMNVDTLVAWGFEVWVSWFLAVLKVVL